ncbi:MAG: leucine-rich repeat protein [Muribaculaceae bacterium]|nr:leucine-rich repeat protein [Muribaculaceae bacterium]
MKKFLLSLLVALTALCVSAQTFDVGLLKYTIDTDGTAMCMGLSTAAQSANPTKIVIPGRVNYNGKTYRVDVVNTSAFQNNKTITTVTIGWGVRYIYTYAFNQCTALKFLNLSSSVKEIRAYSFAGSKVDQIYISTQTAPTLAETAFNALPAKPYIVASTKTGADALNANANWKALDRSGTISHNGLSAHDIYYNNQAYDYISTDLDVNNPEVMMVGCNRTGVITPQTVYDAVPKDYGGLSNETNCTFRKIAPYACKDNTTITSMGRSDTYMTSITEIGEHAFDGCTNLESVYIDADKVGNYAFEHCTKLKTLKLYYTAGEGSGVQTIGQEAFRGTGLTSLYIPSSVTSIGAGAFCYTNSLEKIQVSSSNPNYAASSGGWLYNKNFTTVVQVPGACTTSAFVSGTRTINAKAFFGNNKISAIWVPYGVTSIGSMAFGYMSNLTALKIPSSVTSLHQYALDYLTNLYDLYVNIGTPPSSITNASSSLDQVRTACRLHVPRGCVSAYKNASRWNQLTAVDEGGWDFVAGSPGLYFTVASTSSYTDTKVSSSSYNGYVRVVKGWYALSSATQPSGAITIPNTVSDNGYSFIVAELDNNLFSNNTGITSVSGGAGVKWINQYAFYGCTNLTSCSIPNPTFMGNCAFMNSSKLSNISLGDRLQTINEFAFSSTAIKQLIMPNTVTKIGTQMVYNCNSLDSIKISTGLTDIPMYAFSKCHAKYIRLPYGVKTVGVAIVANSDYSYAVDHVVIVPSSVTSINANAFKFADKLAAVYLNLPHSMFTTTTENWIRSGSNYNHKGVTKLYVPVGQVSAYEGDAGVKAAFYMSDVNSGAFDFHFGAQSNLKSMYYMTVVDASAKTAKYVYSPNDTGGTYALSSTETDNLTGIAYKMVELGDSACAGHTKITGISWGGNIDRIGKWAFQGCTGLASEITIPDYITKLDSYAFYNCTKLPSIYIPRSTIASMYSYFFGNNASNFRCYVDMSQYYKYYKWANGYSSWTSGGVKAADQFAPFVKPTTEWTALSVMKPVTLPTNDGVTFYTVPSYDSGKEMVKTDKRTGSVAAATGLLMKATVGKVYRFTTTSSTTAPANLLKGVEGEKTELSPSGAYFTFNPSTKKFDRITKTTTINNGGAFLEMGSLVGSGTQSIQIDQFYVSPNIRGDVNGDNVVDVDDLNIIINIMIKKATLAQWPNADINKSGTVDVDDMNIVINIMVHKDNG